MTTDQPRMSDCPDYDGVPEHGGPCWTCRGDPAHCPMSADATPAANPRQVLVNALNPWMVVEVDGERSIATLDADDLADRALAALEAAGLRVVPASEIERMQAWHFEDERIIRERGVEILRLRTLHD